MVLCLCFLKVCCARARAPNVMVPISCSPWRDPSSEFNCYLSFAGKNGNSFLTSKGSTSISESLDEPCLSGTGEDAAPNSSSLSYFNGLIRIGRVSARSSIVCCTVMSNICKIPNWLGVRRQRQKVLGVR